MTGSQTLFVSWWKSPMKLTFWVLFLALVGPGWAATLEPMSSAEFCGRCHRAIFEAWKSSSHAQAMESRLFQDALELTETDYGVSARKTCLACHSPIGVKTGDFSLHNKVTWEGITCDYCHSLREVSLTGVNPKATVEYTLEKSGPLKDVNSSAHGTVYSPVHVSSLACAPCHEYRNSLGFPVLTTFSEWKNSPYAKEGKQCQSCHMYQVAGDVVDPRIQRTNQAQINLHQMPGGHSADQLTKAIFSQLSTSRKGDQLRVDVSVTNRSAGHYVPTGSPMRQVELELRVDSNDGKHLREQRLFRRVVADQQGKVLPVEPAAFFRAAKVLSDTRLAPGEKRVEAFSFAVPAGTQCRVTATFWYYYSPLARTESQKQITFLTISRIVN
jgi:Cytochrome c554 and c-prime